MQVNEITSLPLLENSMLTQVKSGEDFKKMLETSVEKIQQDEKNKTKLYESCKNLESVFINQMLQAMQKTVPENSFFGNSFAMETFQGMLFEEYSKIMNQQKSFGIAEALYQQLSGEKYKG